MFRVKPSLSVFFLCALACCLSTVVGIAADQGVAVLEGRARAKGVSVLRATIPAPCPGNITLKIPNEQLGDKDSPAILTNYGVYIQTTITDNDECQIIVPTFAGPFDHNQIGFAFWHPGIFPVRWEFDSTEASPTDRAIEQTVDVGESSAPDLSFIDRVSDRKMIRHLFGKDFFEHLGPTNELLGPHGEDLLALKVIAQLLKATRDQDPSAAVRDRKSAEELRVWGDSLWSLAQALPDSSYAPYAAYYAGCCFVSLVGERIDSAVRERIGPQGVYNAKTGREVTKALLQEDGDASHARDAFLFAADRADAYLRPLALYRVATYHVAAAHINEAEEVFAKLQLAAPGKGRIQDWSLKIRKELDELQASVEPTNK